MKGGYMVGTRTWGGTGPHFQTTSPGLTNGGCFTHNKFWTQAYQTGFQLVDINYRSYEEIGVPPNEPVTFDAEVFNSNWATADKLSPSRRGGKDVQLEAAIAAAARYIAKGAY
jgi:hypothetical protein